MRMQSRGWKAHEAALRDAIRVSYALKYRYKCISAFGISLWSLNEVKRECETYICVLETWKEQREPKHLEIKRDGCQDEGHNGVASFQNSADLEIANTSCKIRRPNVHKVLTLRKTEWNSMEKPLSSIFVRKPRNEFR